jgi:4-diphosphocytidyl-2C-methyl-D-erythritol kinase
MLILKGQMERSTGGRQDREVRRLGEELANHSRRVGQLLEVVQDQQHVSVPDVFKERRRRSALTRDAKVFRDRAPHDVGSGGGRQRNEIDAVGARRAEDVGSCDRQSRLA